MLDLKFIRENPDAVKKAIVQKKVGLDLDELLAQDQVVLKLKQQAQELQEKRNAHSKKIPKATNEERPALIEEGRKIGSDLDAMKPMLNEEEEKLKQLLYLVPMIPSPEAPIGKDDSENVEVKKAGKLPEFSIKASIFDILGSNFIGISKDKQLLAGNTNVLVTKMKIAKLF